MAGLYRVIMGEDPAAALLRKIFKIRRRDCGRYRDIFLLRRAGVYRVCLLTRNGEGGFNQKDEFKAQRDFFTKHPQFVRQYSDPGDPTYITTEFSIPEDQKEMIHTFEKKRWTCEKHKLDSMREKIDKMNSGEIHDPEVQRLMQWGEKVFKPMIEKAMKEGVNLTSSDGEVEVLVVPGASENKVIVDKER